MYFNNEIWHFSAETLPYLPSAVPQFMPDVTSKGFCHVIWDGLKLSRINQISLHQKTLPSALWLQFTSNNLFQLLKRKVQRVVLANSACCLVFLSVLNIVFSLDTHSLYNVLNTISLYRLFPCFVWLFFPILWGLYTAFPPRCFIVAEELDNNLHYTDSG